MATEHRASQRVGFRGTQVLSHSGISLLIVEWKNHRLKTYYVPIRRHGPNICLAWSTQWVYFVKVWKHLNEHFESADFTCKSRSVVLETDQLRLSTRNPWAEGEDPSGCSLPRAILTARSTALCAFPAPAFLASATCPTPAAFWVQDPWHTLSHLQRSSGLELFIQKPVEN